MCGFRKLLNADVNFNTFRYQLLLRPTAESVTSPSSLNLELIFPNKIPSFPTTHEIFSKSILILNFLQARNETLRLKVLTVKSSLCKWNTHKDLTAGRSMSSNRSYIQTRGGYAIATEGFVECRIAWKLSISIHHRCWLEEGHLSSFTYMGICTRPDSLFTDFVYSPEFYIIWENYVPETGSVSVYRWW